MYKILYKFATEFNWCYRWKYALELKSLEWADYNEVDSAKWTRAQLKLTFHYCCKVIPRDVVYIRISPNCTDNWSGKRKRELQFFDIHKTDSNNNLDAELTWKGHWQNAHNGAAGTSQLAEKCAGDDITITNGGHCNNWPLLTWNGY